jgi:putative ABC transport system ATP-binding protein
VGRLGRIFHIRFELYQRKFTAKFLNNLLAQMTPFLIYLLGGYFVLFGNMQVGAVVGVLLAYKDLPGPVKELIDWDQQRQDMQQRYEQVIEQFEPEGMMSAELQAMPDAAAPPFTGDVKLNSVVVAEEGGVRALDAVTLSFPILRKVAVVGGAGGGKELLAQVVAKVVQPTGGGVVIGENNLAGLPEATTGSRLSYVGQDVYLLPVTIRDNILYGLKFRPRSPEQYEGDALRRREIEEREAERAGNPVLDVAADWVDYEAAGATGPEDMDRHIIEALRVVELDGDVYRYGLRGTIDPAQRPAVADSVLKARAELHSRLADPTLAGLVEPFDRGRYNRNMSVAENVLFGTPVGRTFDPENITANPYMRRVLNELELATPLAEMGVEIARTMVELFADLPAGHPFFEQFSFITAEELPEYRALITRLSGRTVADVSPAERARLRALPFRYIEARHRLGLIDEAMEQRLLAARHAFAEHLPPEYASDIEFYDVGRYNGAATLQDNILFGRLVYGQAGGADRIGDLITEVLDGLQLRGAVIEVGLDYNVGVAGKRLSAGQRQKVGIARALIKRPDLLVLNEPTAVLDAATQQRLLDKILAARGERGVLWTLSRTAQAEHFDEVIVMQGGRMTARGAPAELSGDKSYTDLLAAG